MPRRERLPGESRPLYEGATPYPLAQPKGELPSLEGLKGGGNSQLTSETAVRRPADDDDVMRDSHGERRPSFRYSLTAGEGIIN